MTDNKPPEPWDIYIHVDIGDYGLSVDTQIELNNRDATDEQMTILKYSPVLLHEMESLAKALEDVHDVPDSFLDAIREARGL